MANYQWLKTKQLFDRDISNVKVQKFFTILLTFSKFWGEHTFSENSEK